MYSKMPTKPKICIFFQFGLPTIGHAVPFHIDLASRQAVHKLVQLIRVGNSIRHKWVLKRCETSIFIPSLA